MTTLSNCGRSPGELQKRKRNASWLEWRRRRHLATHPPLSDLIVLERIPYPISCSQWRSVTVRIPNNVLCLAHTLNTPRYFQGRPTSGVDRRLDHVCDLPSIPHASDVSMLSTETHQWGSVHFSCSTIALGSSDCVMFVCFLVTWR
jgi:hypothetical protein